MNGNIRSLTLLAILSAVALCPVAAHADDTDFQQCRKETVPVTLSATDPTVYNLVGWLCWRGNIEGKTVQLVMHGLTYDHFYWDWPFEPQRYSYVRRATSAGYVTFNVDRIGYARSDHPPADRVDVSSGAFVAHELVQKLRDGSIGGTAFPKVMLVGHSYGSVISWHEASSYRDVDAVLVSGALHDVNPVALDLFVTHPAEQDPKFARAGLPAGYLTTVPGTRPPIFFDSTNVAPLNLALDELLKQTFTAAEFATAMSPPSVTQQIDVPVFVAVGETDLFFCNEAANLSCASSDAVLARESRYYAPQACLETFVLHGSGHDMNLQLNASVWFDAAIDWTNRRVGPSASVGPTQPCR